MKTFLTQKRFAVIATSLGAAAAMAIGLPQTADVYAQLPQEAKRDPNQPVVKEKPGIGALGVGGPTSGIGPNMIQGQERTSRNVGVLGGPGGPGGLSAGPGSGAYPGGLVGDPAPVASSGYPGLPPGVPPGPEYFGYPSPSMSGNGWTFQHPGSESKQLDVPLEGTLQEELKKYLVVGFESTWTSGKLQCLVFDIEGTKVSGFVANEGELITLGNASSGLESVITQLVAMHQQVESIETKQEYKKLAIQVTGYLFQIQQLKRNTELLALENRLAKLRASSLKREQMSQQIIDNRVDELLGLNEGLGWSE
jgi:hypothetical protein